MGKKYSTKQTPQNNLLWVIINTSQNICLFFNNARQLTHSQLVTQVTLGSSLQNGLQEAQCKALKLTPRDR